MRLNKYEAMTEWLDANPGKEETDWLLEVRCKDESQREEFKGFLERVKAGVRSGDFWVAPVCDHVDIQKRPSGTPNCMRLISPDDEEDECVDPEFDFCYCGYHFDLDAPESLFKDVIPGANMPQSGWKYLEWKARQLGVEDTTFVMEARKRFREFQYGLTHWRDLDKMIHKG